MNPDTLTLFERIRANCIEEGDCLIWTGRVSPCGLPITNVGPKRSTVSVRRVVYEHKHGPIKDGLQVTPSCGNARCICHLSARTKKAICKAAAKRGAYSNPARIRKATLTRRAQSHITDEIVEIVRSAATPQIAQAETGIHISTCYRIRDGSARAQLNSPWAGLGGRA